MIEAGVALGANLGDPASAFLRALNALAAEDSAASVTLSGLFDTAPVGGPEQPPFVNAVAVIRTDLSPECLLDRLHELEHEAGRVRGEHWGPRVLDLDLLWHGDSIANDSTLNLPHPGIRDRSFVLEPLAEIHPNWRHPVEGKTAREMRDELAASGRWTPCRRIGPLPGWTGGEAV
ncbi:MAG: 2-amino-4-hydroxy-6-hydroxymethyldihydropteridine diphosphokinase [Gemmatimonadota bacterium]|nr:2-amino-4-hydroxy-6-hydroxymethyldihydropteridine diphosphokinase [Gemmatimonadota bacterium]MDP6529855.1 2-amino-4-hydroxy-6-hydroxymethyldihydropteridine diphosphokinase [Gemmatimonadota bacterium]MDP6802798.1 2-amino-4-hydroxy-6-hydroxymethyldihydropteridine diphosphokinase [Gemmatimonadota bacterium]MDP7032721.1 2-amino-4-hydroxy-6-hydroxymethyldihydropteridine diphosphokinase [Gemmatimonadota bacterium]